MNDLDAPRRVLIGAARVCSPVYAHGWSTSTLTTSCSWQAGLKTLLLYTHRFQLNLPTHRARKLPRTFSVLESPPTYPHSTAYRSIAGSTCQSATPPAKNIVCRSFQSFLEAPVFQRPLLPPRLRPCSLDLSSRAAASSRTHLPLITYSSIAIQPRHLHHGSITTPNIYTPT